MVRCSKFYEVFDVEGNFCNKSAAIVKKIQSHIEYMKRNKFGDYEINSNAIEPFINIEHLNNGVVHKLALKELRKKVRRVGASEITRRISIELINKANSMVLDRDKIDSIPDVGVRMGSYEHAIEGIEHETREMFDEFKKEIDIRDNNKVIKAMFEYCKDHIDDVKCTMMFIEQRELENSEIEVVSET